MTLKCSEVLPLDPGGNCHPSDFCAQVNFHRFIRICFFRSTSNFQESLVQKEEEEIFGKGHKGRDMKRSCRTWGSIIHVWIWDWIEQNELPPKTKANLVTKDKRGLGALKKEWGTEAVWNREFGFHLWFQLLFDQMGPTDLQHSSARIYSESNLSWLQWICTTVPPQSGSALSVLSNPDLFCDFHRRLAMRTAGFTGVMRGQHNHSLMAGLWLMALPSLSVLQVSPVRAGGHRLGSPHCLRNRGIQLCSNCWASGQEDDVDMNPTFFGGCSLGEILKGLNDQLQEKKIIELWFLSERKHPLFRQK